MGPAGRGEIRGDFGLEEEGVKEYWDVYHEGRRVCGEKYFCMNYERCF